MIELNGWVCIVLTDEEDLSLSQMAKLILEIETSLIDFREFNHYLDIKAVNGNYSRRCWCLEMAVGSKI
jgi:hypothetical protein